MTINTRVEKVVADTRRILNETVVHRQEVLFKFLKGNSRTRVLKREIVINKLLRILNCALFNLESYQFCFLSRMKRHEAKLSELFSVKNLGGVATKQDIVARAKRMAGDFESREFKILSQTRRRIITILIQEVRRIDLHNLTKRLNHVTRNARYEGEYEDEDSDDTHPAL